MPLSRMAVGCNSINFTTLSMVYFVRKCAIYEYEYSYTVIWGSIAWFVCGYGIALHVIKKKKNLLFVILKMHQMWPKTHPVPLARNVPNCTLTHAFYHVFTRSARTVSNHFSFNVAPRFAAPHVKQLPPYQRKELKQSHKMHNSAMRPKLPCMRWKSRRKLLVSVVSAVGSHHNRS